MANIVHSFKGSFHRDLVSNPFTHGWVLNLYLGGERYPQQVCDYFQSKYAPTMELSRDIERHAKDEDKHVHLFSQALKSIEQPVVNLAMEDIFNEVIRMFTPGTFYIVETDLMDTRRYKLANFLAHAHHLEKRVAQSFSYHMDACEKAGQDRIPGIVALVKQDEDRHVSYTKEAVFDLLPRKEASEVMETHRRAEAKANLLFSKKQVRVFLEKFGNDIPRHRKVMYQLCAMIMEEAGRYV
jgi:hypothetical protein